MTHDTVGTTNLEMLSAMLWEAGWDYVQGCVYQKEYKGQMLKGYLTLKGDYYALVACNAEDAA